MHFSPILIQNKMKIFVRFTNFLEGVFIRCECRTKNRTPDFIRYLVGVVWHCRQSGDCFSQTSCWEKISRVHHYVKLGKKVHQWCISPESSWPSIPNETSEKPLFHALRNVGKWMLTDAFSPRSK